MTTTKYLSPSSHQHHHTSSGGFRSSSSELPPHLIIHNVWSPPAAEVPDTGDRLCNFLYLGVLKAKEMGQVLQRPNSSKSKGQWSGCVTSCKASSHLCRGADRKYDLGNAFWKIHINFFNTQTRTKLRACSEVSVSCRALQPQLILGVTCAIQPLHFSFFASVAGVEQAAECVSVWSFLQCRGTQTVHSRHLLWQSSPYSGGRTAPGREKCRSVMVGLGGCLLASLVWGQGYGLLSLFWVFVIFFSTCLQIQHRFCLWIFGENWLSTI